VFLVLDIFLFYVFFESTLPPLFLLIGLFGSDNKVRASLYLFLYTLSMGVGYPGPPSLFFKERGI
jgi:NADH-ubiquinone oxidoreductase chain 4